MILASDGTAIVLTAHGTVDSLDDLPEFLTNIRRGHAPPPELVTEVRRRYAAIGGSSPLNGIGREVARKLEARLGLRVRLANRLFHPYPKEVLAELAASGVRRVLTIALAQHSAAVYAGAVRAAAKELAVTPPIEVVAAPNWGRTPELTTAFADRVAEVLHTVKAEEIPAEQVALVFTAHSLPLSIVRAGDPYETEVRASAEDVARSVLARHLTAPFAEHVVAFQSQGIGTGVEWLGPDLRQTLEELAARGRKHVILAPTGFLADHVEILYDLDIEAKAWCEGLGIVLYRTTSLNADDRLIDALSAVARETLDSP